MIRLNIKKSFSGHPLDAQHTTSTSHDTFPLHLLVGGFNPFEKYARQIGFIFPNFRDEHKKYLSCHHPVYHKNSNPFIVERQKTTNPMEIPKAPELKTCHRFSLHGVVPSTGIQGPPDSWMPRCPNQVPWRFDLFFCHPIQVDRKKCLSVFTWIQKNKSQVCNFV